MQQYYKNKKDKKARARDKAKNIYKNEFETLDFEGQLMKLNDFKHKKGSVTQTILAKIDVIIHNNNENEVNLFVRRSF